ncbi:MAG: 2-oxoacid:acceptor oxidoreductase family protein [Candidatus Eisenbacteria bacterium]
MRREIRITGFGGQGVVLAGYILGKAAAVYDHQAATLVQSYGPEARGSACAAQVVVADDTIHYPYIRRQEVLVAMSQEGYDSYVGEIQEGGTVLYDQDLVEIGAAPPRAARVAAIPATRLAEKMGRRMAANIVMLGFMVGCTGLVSDAAIREAVRTSVPPGTEDFNLAALEQGLNHARDTLQKQEIPAADGQEKR